ncbi:MAG TPA: hypothetical protein VKV27_02115 [Solirubrobacteraceae bacterium]|nr:hypothetical protein [Solirubrobacteraceae bacterium]
MVVIGGSGRFRGSVLGCLRAAVLAPALGAECMSVRDGKIVHSRSIFDRAPFEAARRQQPAQRK